MFKVNIRNTRTRCKISSKLTIKTPNNATGVDRKKQRSTSICMNQKLVKDELNYLRDVSINGNNYPPHLVQNIIKHESGKQAKSYCRY